MVDTDDMEISNKNLRYSGIVQNVFVEYPAFLAFIIAEAGDWLGINHITRQFVCTAVIS